MARPWMFFDLVLRYNARCRALGWTIRGGATHRAQAAPQDTPAYRYVGGHEVGALESEETS